MTTRFTLFILAGSLSIAGCVADSSNLWDMKNVDVGSRLNISFDPGNPEFKRTAAASNRNEHGWVESGTWQAETDSATSEVWIFVASLFSRAFTKEGDPGLPTLVRSNSADSFVELGREDRIKSNSGPIDYIYYRASGQPCVMIQKYWSRPRLSSDASRAISLQWVAGNNLVRAYYCKPGGDDLQRSDLDWLLSGIEATELYWPDNIFLPADETF